MEGPPTVGQTDRREGWGKQTRRNRVEGQDDSRKRGKEGRRGRQPERASERARERGKEEGLEQAKARSASLAHADNARAVDAQDTLRYGVGKKPRAHARARRTFAAYAPLRPSSLHRLAPHSLSPSFNSLRFISARLR
eukprot:3832726-Pleurochrysis_carterae.AAC.1